MGVTAALLRLHFSATMPLVVPLTVYYARAGKMSGMWLKAWLTALALSLLMMGAYAINDAVDVEVDRVNLPDRPLPSGRVRCKTAVIVGVALTSAALGVGALVGWPVVGVLSAIALGLLGYNLTSKRLGRLKQVVVAVLVVCMYPLSLVCSGVPEGRRVDTLFAFPVWMLLTAYGFEVYKDLRDMPGDLQAGRRVMAWHDNPEKWRRVADGVLGLGAVSLVLPGWLGNTWLYLALVSPAVLIGLWLWRLPLRAAMAAVYVQFILVGLAATTDVVVSP